MTPNQEKLYWREWSSARAALRELGHKLPDNELRHWLTAQALGDDKPHRAFSNVDFDRWLSVVRGYTAMADLGEQLRLQEQPLRRCMFACNALLNLLKIEFPGREAYVRAIYTRVQAKRAQCGAEVFDLDQIPDADIPLILAALTHTAEHKNKTGHNHPVSGKGRARYDHQVGARSEHPDATAPLDQSEPELVPAETFNPDDPF